MFYSFVNIWETALQSRGIRGKLVLSFAQKWEKEDCMKCKFCNAEMDEGAERCPVCGEEVVQKKKPKAWKIVLAVVGCVVLLAVLAGAVLYGLGVDLRPRENDIFYKDNYVVSDQKAEKKADTVIATVGNKELTNGELQIYYQRSVASFLDYYGYYASMMGLDMNKPFHEQVQDPETGLTWQQYFLKNALETWQRYATLRMLAEDEKFEGSEDTQQMLTKVQEDLKKTSESLGFSSVADMITEKMGAGATEEGYMSYLSAYYESLAYYNEVYKRLEPTDEQVETYFTENEEKFTQAGITKDGGIYVDVRHILLVPEGGSKDDNGDFIYSDEEWAACEQKAQAVLDEWLAGEATEDTFAELAGTYSVDGSKDRGGLYTNVKKGDMVKPFEDWCFDESRQVGDYGLVRSEFGYHVMFFSGSEPIWHNTAVSEYMAEHTEEFLQDGMERWPMKVNYKKMVLSGDESQEGTEPTATVPATSGTTAAEPETTTAPQESTAP